MKVGKSKFNNCKLIVIVGPTASGKSQLAVRLAKKFNGEVISADSRQVYKGMNIGTGKVTKKEMANIPHHLLDVASPKRKFTVAQYRKLTLKTLNKILKKGTLPIICGGSGFYIQAVIDGITIPQVPPDWKLRKKLDKKSPKELFRILKKLDPRRARIIDKKNRRRLIRAIEIATKIGRTPLFKKKPLPYPVLIIGIKKEKKELNSLIKKRLLKRLKRGMIAEVKRLKNSGLSWERLEEFGLEYRWIARYLQKKITLEEMKEKLEKDIINYAKKQMTWFKKDERIHWTPPNQQPYKYAEKLTKAFLNK